MAEPLSAENSWHGLTISSGRITAVFAVLWLTAYFSSGCDDYNIYVTNLMISSCIKTAYKISYMPFIAVCVEEIADRILPNV